MAGAAHTISSKRGWGEWSTWPVPATGFLPYADIAMRGVAAEEKKQPGAVERILAGVAGVGIAASLGPAGAAVGTVPLGIAGSTQGFEGIVDTATGLAGIARSLADLAGKLGAIVEALGRGVAWLTTPANWGRVAMVVIGGAVIIVGLAELAQQAFPETGKNVARVAGAAVPG